MTIGRKELAKNGFFSAFHKNGLSVPANKRPARRKDGQSKIAAASAIQAGRSKQAAKLARRAAAAFKVANSTP